jgi:preprotein translocase subunit SecB
MSDDDQQPVFSIQKVYVKDLSLEVPTGPKAFLEAGQPQFEVNLRNQSGRVNETLFEAAVKVTVTAKVNDKVLFLVEVEQGAIFQVANVPEADMGPLLGIACPNIIFPYARETIADLIMRAGFPPIHLAPVNFEAIYAASQQQKKNGEDGSAPRIEIAH